MIQCTQVREAGHMQLSRWHSEWQRLFDPIEREVPHPMLPGCVSARRADVVRNGVVLEFQHSPISREEVAERCRDYAVHGKRVVWILDGCETTHARYHRIHDGRVLIKLKQHWMYEAFGTDHAVYLDAGDRVWRLDRGDVRCGMALVSGSDGVPGAEFVRLLRDHTASLSPSPSTFARTRRDDDARSTLYLNQRGAGCGKTFESVQLITADPRFAHKTEFIYLTKQHTAKKVIHSELVQQVGSGRLQNVDADLFESSNLGKQYRVKMARLGDGTSASASASVSVIVGTIDSFMYALGDREGARSASGDFFEALRRSLIDGYVDGFDARDGGFRYAKDRAFITRETLVIVDEAQDLNLGYLEALAAVTARSGFDIYVIGDKMQSIWGGDNLFACIDRERRFPGCRVVASAPDNRVRRFRHPGLADFVNRCVQFGRYGLPPVTVTAAAAAEEDGDGDPPVVLFQQPNRRIRNSLDEECVFVQRIVDLVDREVDTHGYLPRNFLFIFPVIKSNVLALRLETRLNDYWIEKLRGAPLPASASEAGCDREWAASLRGGKFQRHAFMHRSEEDKPIDLDESEHATRLLSIHAAKGLGCDVVFLLGLTEASLRRYSGGDMDIVYESLLHVAITRQKRRLYVGVPADSPADDIHRRLTSGSAVVQQLLLSVPKASIRPAEVIEYVERYAPQWRDRFAHEYLESAREAIDAQMDQERESSASDWGHHVIRRCVMEYSLFYLIAMATPNTTKKGQFWAMMHDFAECEVLALPHAAYYEMLNKLTVFDVAGSPNGAANGSRPKVIPVLRYGGDVPATRAIDSEYGRRCEDFCDIIRALQTKVRRAIPDWKLPGRLCPFEMCVLAYALEVRRRGKFSELVVTEVYDILCSVRYVCDALHAREFDCLCVERLCRGSPAAPPSPSDAAYRKHCDLRTSICKHREASHRIQSLFYEMKARLQTLDPASTFTFYTKHYMSYGASANPRDLRLFERDLPFVAISDAHVVLMRLCPSFTRLQRDHVLIESLLYTLMACQSPEGSSNYNRFVGKHVIVCMFTYSHGLVWIDMHQQVNGTLAASRSLRECIADCFRARFRRTNQAIWDRFRSLAESLDGSVAAARPSSLARLVEEVKRAAASEHAVPAYIAAALDRVKRESRELRRCALRSADPFDSELEASLIEWLLSCDDDKGDAW